LPNPTGPGPTGPNPTGPDQTGTIAATARVDPQAVIGPGAVIGDFAVVERDVVIGPECRLEPYVYVKRWTTLGARNRVSAGTVLGTDPLDKNFKGGRSYLKIGDDNVIREHFTISRGTAEESETTIGSANYIMTGGHIAHNCKIGDNTVIASCALVAGYVEVASHAFISGGVAIHQYSKIGSLAMIGGNASVNLDAPPYFLYEGGGYLVPRGVNLVGLKRNGLSASDIQALKTAYRILYRSGLKLADALRQIESQVPTEHTRHLVEFIRTSKRGICREPKSR